MKTRNILIVIPLEPPAIPENFELDNFRVMDIDSDKEIQKFIQLDSAGIRWAYLGSERLSLTAFAYGYIGNSEYEIYSVWDDNEEKWGEWVNSYNNKPFDFEDFQERLRKFQAGESDE